MSKFWWEVALEDMSREQWEALCDGCGLCCLTKLQDDETEEIFYTRLSCELLDIESCQCKDYSDRLQKVEDCLHLNPQNLQDIDWLPVTCAYRLIKEGKDLFEWHHLLSGSKASVHEAGISVSGKAVSKKYVPEEDFEDHIVKWVDI